MAASRSAAKASLRDELKIFVWEGTDKRGTKMKGEQPSKSENFVRAELRKMGINPTSVRPKPKPLFGGAGKRISAKDIAVFSRQIATMLRSGVPIVSSMEIIAGGQKNPKAKDLYTNIRTSIEGGRCWTPSPATRKTSNR